MNCEGRKSRNEVLSGFMRRRGRGRIENGVELNWLRAWRTPVVACNPVMNRDCQKATPIVHLQKDTGRILSRDGVEIGNPLL